MQRFWGWLGLNLGKRAGVVAMVGLALTMLFGLGVTKLRFTTTNADYLNPKDPAWLANVNYEKNFGGDPMAVMFTMNKGKTVDDLLTQNNIDEMKTIAQKLGKDPWVYSYVTPLDALSLSNVLLSSPDGIVLDSPAAQILENAVKRDPSKAAQAIRFKYLSTEGTLESSFAQDEQVFTNPKWMHFLLHEPPDYGGHIRQAVGTFVPNDKHALLAVYLQGGISVNQEAVAAQSVTTILNSAHWDNATTLTTGVPELLATINDYLKHGILILAAVAAGLMLTILALSFNVRWRFLAFAIVAVGSIWAFGLVGFFGIPLTLATIAALPTLLGIGMDYAIQMHSRIEEEVVLARSPHPVQASARGLSPALLVVTFDAVFAFMAMWFAKTPAIREFGSLLVVGIVAVCVFSIIATLAVLGIREYKSPTKGKDFSTGRLSRLVAWLSSVPARFAVPLGIISVVVFLGGVVAEGHLHIQTDAVSWVNPHSKAIMGIKQLKAGTGSANEIAVNLTTPRPFSDDTVRYAVSISRQLEKKYKGALLPATGIINTLDQVINNVPGTTEVPPTGAQIEGLFLLSTPGIRRTTMANDGHSINIIFRAVPDTLSTLEPVVKDLQGGLKPPPGFHLAPGGIAIVGVGLIENIEKSRVELTYLAVLFVGAFLALRLRSLVRSLLSLVPVLTAVGAVSLVAVAFNLKLSPVTAVAGPLVVAVCTEFTSLILLRFVEERQRGFSPAEAMDLTARRTGRAFMVSGMTAVAGIGTLATSSMPLLSEFGTIVALNLTVALVSALVVLPPILVAAENHGWVTRGLLKKADTPFIEFDRPEAGAAPPSPFEPPAPMPPPVPVGAAPMPYATSAPVGAVPFYDAPAGAPVMAPPPPPPPPGNGWPVSPVTPVSPAPSLVPTPPVETNGDGWELTTASNHVTEHWSPAPDAGPVAERWEAAVPAAPAPEPEGWAPLSAADDVPVGWAPTPITGPVPAPEVHYAPAPPPAEPQDAPAPEVQYAPPPPPAEPQYASAPEVQYAPPQVQYTPPPPPPPSIAYDAPPPGQPYPVPPPPDAYDAAQAMAPQYAEHTATAVADDELLAGFGAPEPTQPRSRGGRLATIAARLVGLHDR